jgi:DNA-binding response OmpR family regulator
MGERLTIMVIEDNLAVVELYRITLEHQGHKVVFTAESGAMVESAIAENRLPEADLAVVDHQLIGAVKGLDVARLILHTFPRTKILMATGEDSIKKQALESGFLVLIKPFSMSAFNEVLGGIRPLHPEALPIGREIIQGAER